MLPAVPVVVKVALIGFFSAYAIAAFKCFLDEGYSVLNSICQSSIHLLFCSYLLFGWVNLLLNTPGLGLSTLVLVGFLWLLSCYCLYTILEYFQSLIPRQNPDEPLS